jgi:predicted SAM-dependent methyltransferase
VNISDKCRADIVADVREPWTWATEPIEMIKADNLLEHLTPEERITVINEAYDKMAEGGIFWIRVPLLKMAEENILAAFTDPTHKSFFTIQTFDYWDKNHQRGKVFGRDYGIKLWTRIRNEEWRENKRFLIDELCK